MASALSLRFCQMIDLTSRSLVQSSMAHGVEWQARVCMGSGTEIPCTLGTSGSMRIAAFQLRSQACQLQNVYAISQISDPDLWDCRRVYPGHVGCMGGSNRAAAHHSYP